MSRQEIEQAIKEKEYELENVHGTETEVYARIVGYYRAVKNWNAGKAQEFKERLNFNV
jgi:anaerobic ribonucleoside-triphosphate reductase